MNYKKILLKLKRKPRVHGYISLYTETKLSPIHGLGLFAKRDISKNSVIAGWGGVMTTKKEIEKLSKNIGYHYALEIYRGFYLAERNESELDSSDFINHSCFPNCKIVNELMMVSKHRIKKGEELTSDFSNHTRRGKRFICSCNSKNCKKIIYFN
jgi:SET domain-containing protein